MEPKDSDVWMSRRWVREDYFRAHARRAPELSRRRTKHPYHGETRCQYERRMERQFGLEHGSEAVR